MTVLKTALAVAVFAATAAGAASAWDPVRDLTGKRADEHARGAARDLKNLPRSVRDCARNFGACVDKNAKRLVYAAFWPVIERYKAHLFNQGKGRWQTLPESLIAAAQQHYPEINLRGVRYATGVDTVHGQAITWNDAIFFPRNVDVNAYDDLRLMLHELEHVVQYRRRGGDQAFISEYVLKAPGKVIERGSFSVHDHMDLERAADAKASRLVDDIFAVMSAVSVYPMQDRVLVMDQANTAAPTSMSFPVRIHSSRPQYEYGLANCRSNGFPNYDVYSNICF